MSEWLGKGLQNLLHQFESGWHLPKRLRQIASSTAQSFFLHIISGAQFTAQNFGRRILVAVFFTAACFAKLIRPLKGEKWMLFLAEPVIQQVHKLIILQSPLGEITSSGGACATKRSMTICSGTRCTISAHNVKYFSIVSSGTCISPFFTKWASCVPRSTCR